MKQLTNARKEFKLQEYEQQFLLTPLLISTETSSA